MNLSILKRAFIAITLTACFFAVSANNEFFQKAVPMYG